MSGNLRVLVIGGVACGPKTAARLMRLMPEAEVTMIEKGEMVSYGACGVCAFRFREYVFFRYAEFLDHFTCLFSKMRDDLNIYIFCAQVANNSFNCHFKKRLVYDIHELLGVL